MHGFGRITEIDNKIVIEAEFIHGEYANKAEAKVISLTTEDKDKIIKEQQRSKLSETEGAADVY